MAYKHPLIDMKTLLATLLLAGWSITAHSQDFTFPKNGDGEYEFSEIVEIEASKATLFANATSWAMSYYEEEGYKNVIQFESETDGRIIIKNVDAVLNRRDIKMGKVHFESENIYYTLTIDCKDNKYRFIINDIKIKTLSYSPVFGNDMEWDMTHEKHLEKIDQYKQELENLKKQAETLKGGKKTKTQKQIDELKEKEEGEKEMYQDEYNIFERLIKSLKKKMLTNSDF